MPGIEPETTHEHALPPQTLGLLVATSGEGLDAARLHGLARDWLVQRSHRVRDEEYLLAERSLRICLEAAKGPLSSGRRHYDNLELVEARLDLELAAAALEPCLPWIQRLEAAEPWWEVHLYLALIRHLEGKPADAALLVQRMLPFGDARRYVAQRRDVTSKAFLDLFDAACSRGGDRPIDTPADPQGHLVLSTPESGGESNLRAALAGAEGVGGLVEVGDQAARAWEVQRVVLVRLARARDRIELETCLYDHARHACQGHAVRPVDPAAQGLEEALIQSLRDGLSSPGD